MHPEVRQDKPGSCPECGMALETAQRRRAAAENRIHPPDASSDRP